jgi:hypothetical protein
MFNTIRKYFIERKKIKIWSIVNEMATLESFEMFCTPRAREQVEKRKIKLSKKLDRLLGKQNEISLG